MEAALYLVYICGGLSVFCAVAAYFVWAIWIHRYVLLYGQRPTFFLFCWAPIVDYRKACRIARRMGGRRVWFLTLYGRLELMAFLFLVAALISLIVWVMRTSP